MDIKRYILVQAILTKENKLVPIWDDKVIFEKTENYGNRIILNDGSRDQYYSLVDCIFDLKTKQLEVGIELNYYPADSDLEFKKEQIILFEKSNRKLEEAKILDIVFEEYEIYIKKGSKLDNWWITKFKDVVIDPNSLYAIKQWKPFYILDNGVKVEYDHQMYHKI